jgi:UDP-N-acetylmuramate: L-alanyl-gamma-D-glutamyl-meso-diaminopimelate ligase
MHIHILGICGTFMGGIAVLARELGFRVTGSDANIYPPMSEQLANLDVELFLQHNVTDLQKLKPDLIVVGNVMSRGMEIVEYILNNNVPYISGPKFIEKYIIPGKHVFAVSGTHGKTTTTSILTWILQYAGLKPGYLIGGVAKNFTSTACLGGGKYFVIEADEYDCAFFDKNSKFMHYHPDTLIINNLEFDHADIFNNLTDIKKQFHNLIRTIPSKSKIIYNNLDTNIKDLLAMGCWSMQESFSLQSADWDLHRIGDLAWQLLGEHNTLNAIAAIGAANSVGVSIATAKMSLKEFSGVSRRLELICTSTENNIKVYSDFAHHPTAINLTIKTAKSQLAVNSRLIVVIDFGSNTMCLGVHQDSLAQAIQKADFVYFYNGKNVQWDVANILKVADKQGKVFSSSELLISHLFTELKLEDNDIVLLMSNSGFGNIRQSISERLSHNVGVV